MKMNYINWCLQAVFFLFEVGGGLGPFLEATIQSTGFHYRCPSGKITTANKKKKDGIAVNLKEET